jgi:hypothetical protein
MVFFTENKEDCSCLTYEDFQNKVLNMVRQINHLRLVDSWEKHIIYRDFQKSTITHGTSYYANIFFANECQKDEPFIIVYEFSYHENYKKGDTNVFLRSPASIYYTHGIFYKEEIEPFRKLLQLFDKNKGRYFSCTLDEFHEPAPEVYRCSVCGVNPVDAENGYDTCSACAKKI